MKKILLLLLFTSLAKAQIINFSDPVFKAKLLSSNSSNGIATNSENFSVAIDANGDGEIEVSEAQLIVRLNVADSFLNNMSGIENFSNLEYLLCDYNNLASLNISSLSALKLLSCSNNRLANLNLNNAAVSLEQVIANNNLLSTINLNGLINLKSLQLEINSLASINLNSLTSLKSLNVGGNPLSNLDVSSLTTLTSLRCNGTPLSTLNVSTLLNLEELEFTNSNINTINLSPLVNLKKLSCGSNGISNLNLSTLINLEELFVYNNQLTTLDLTGLTNLKKLNCASNLLTSLNVNFLTNLTDLAYGNTSLAEVNISNLVNLESFGFYRGTQLPSGLETFSNLHDLSVVDTPMTELDVSYLTRIKAFVANGNTALTFINLKNGAQFDNDQIFFVNNPNLTFVCVNDVDIATATNGILLGNAAIQINSYCSFTPGGNFNTITGKTIFDSNNNGCDASDLSQPFIKVKINDGTNQGATFTSITGDYSFYTQAGNFIVTPEIENPTFFNINPANATVNFPSVDNSVSTNNFCLSANGVHPDLEIVIAPIIPARPGFDAVYKIVYKNKGNQIMTQNYGISFFYNQHLMSFVSATIAPEANIGGALNWSYSNLMPFESRSILVTMNINAPTATNPVNIDDELTFTGNISPQNGDENTFDNLFILNQTVVGSYDPNDIQCLQGDVVSPTEIGNYLHYLIRFENTGTDYAENIVVKNLIDPAKYDLSTMQILGSSHPVNARVQGNMTEFIFQNINLDSGGHGNILLKLKSAVTLQTGDMVSNRVSIYFDYNFPVDTNNADTVFEAMSVTIPVFDNSVKIYPNPANEIVNVKASSAINSVEIYDVQGRILSTNLFNETSASLDLSKYSSGIYYLKIKTDEGSKVEKLLKK